MAKPPKKTDIEDVIVEEAVVAVNEAPVVAEEAPVAVDQQPVSGRAVFAVSRVDVGVAVHTAFLAEDGRLLQMPAVFPNLEYALQQVDEMRQMVINQFATSAV
ncbi:hypothetical protein ICHIJ1_14400 [Fluviibacter phosphoraccumulans]|uniref:hypothetical protein n=1 Tax=Fluviibacter phosphoraccumulans TaxID=1751046 RepID=UPI0013670EA9|nr:hypothetical protein [Fluviibacter phosphoraccumulans]BBU71521.1 hypothetical protein ICHIJ1_14400 [Fluviibacter phosphoraccumulans]